MNLTKDNTVVGTRVSFPEMPFAPRVVYAPDGEGGTPNPSPDAKVPDLNTPEDKSTEDELYPDDKPDDKPDDVDRTKVPEKVEDYAAALTLPEGMEMDTQMLDEVAPLWLASGKTHEEAQAFVDKYIENMQGAANEQADKWDAVLEGWAKQAKEDKQIGGDNFDASVVAAKSALDRFGTPELKQALDNSGMGNHPEVIRLLVNVAKGITDDDVPAGGDRALAKPSGVEEDASELYGETTPNKRG